MERLVRGEISGGVVGTRFMVKVSGGVVGTRFMVKVSGGVGTW